MEKLIEISMDFVKLEIKKIHSVILYYKKIL